ncbi:MAG: DNA replication/repair protein RecF [Chloroflexi bacterium]|nr:DNA replication/repair protein RecF [Chloroflexota bacterium]
MHLTRLALTNFRNYTHLELNLAPGLTLLQGNNACGKTNLLEAVFYLATARSPHAGAERELLRWGASEEPIPFARVEAQVERRNGTQTNLEIVLLQAGEEKGHQTESVEAHKTSGRMSKRIKVNGVPKRALDLLGQLNAVLFLPEDLDLVFGSPGDRRRYLDTTLAQIDPRYGRALSRYNQVLEQRNSLLREFHERPFKPAELEIWDQHLVTEGAYIIARRAETVERYNQLTAEIHPRLTGGAEYLALVYQPSVGLAAGRAVEPALGPGDLPAGRASAVAPRFAQQLASMRSRELGAGLTLVGPHRDDLRFLVDRSPEMTHAMDAITYASRGQGRTIALSLKLAEVALMRAETEEEPVLLLDDVMSELDAPRRAALSQTVMNASQALITATDLEDFTPELLTRAKILRVCEGRVLSEDTGGPQIPVS